MVSVLLVQKPDENQNQYKDLIRKIVPIAQAHDCAVVLDNEPNLVRELDADGTQITSGHHDVLKAIKNLKPDFIVGAANITTRHEAMLCGEAGADYVSFGDFKNTPSQENIDLADWWTNLFQIPSAIFDPQTPIENIKSQSAEFLGLGVNIWSATKPAEEIRLLATRKSPLK